MSFLRQQPAPMSCRRTVRPLAAACALLLFAALPAAAQFGSLRVGNTTSDNGFKVFVKQARTSAGFAIEAPSSSDRLLLRCDGTLCLIDTSGGDPLTLWNSGSERMRIATDGNIGIGTTSPNIGGFGSARVLTILGAGGGTTELATSAADADGSAAGQFTFIVSANTGGSKVIATLQALASGTTANNRGGTFLFYTKSDGGGTFERMRITNAGRVGINTSSPQTMLHVAGATTAIVSDTANTPASAGATCTTGMMAWDSSFIYVCVATNTWKRAAIATW